MAAASVSVLTHSMHRWGFDVRDDRVLIPGSGGLVSSSVSKGRKRVADGRGKRGRRKEVGGGY